VLEVAVSWARWDCLGCAQSPAAYVMWRTPSSGEAEITTRVGKM